MSSDEVKSKSSPGQKMFALFDVYIFFSQYDTKQRVPEVDEINNFHG